MGKRPLYLHVDHPALDGKLLVIWTLVRLRTVLLLLEDWQPRLFIFFPRT